MKHLFVPVLGAALLIPVFGAQAATACKGLPQEQCAKLQVFKDIPACRWMPERQRADGGTTKAHCRGSGKSVPADAVKLTNTTSTQQ